MGMWLNTVSASAGPLLPDRAFAYCADDALLSGLLILGLIGLPQLMKNFAFEYVPDEDTSIFRARNCNTVTQSQGTPQPVVLV
jgi:hypothetical protein